MKKIYLYLSLVFPLVSMMSCNNSGSTDSKDNNEKSSVEKTDSKAATDSVKSNAQAETSSKILTSTQSQMDYMKSSGNWAKYEAGILPQMAQDAPEYCGKVLDRLKNGKKHFVVVDKGKMHLFLYDQFGSIIKKYPIACARNYGNKRQKGDSRTNEGYYDAEGVYDSTNWRFTNDRGYTSPARGVYGPWFIRVVHPIGIHGTSSPGSIGKRCSHGCIRVSNDNIKELIQYVDKGTPIIVSPGPKDMAVNAKEGRPTLAVVTEPGGTKAAPGNIDSEAPTIPSAKTTTKKESSKADSEKGKAKETKAKETSPASDSKKSSKAESKSSSEPAKEAEPAKTQESAPAVEPKPSKEANPAEPAKPASTAPAGEPA